MLTGCNFYHSKQFEGTARTKKQGTRPWVRGCRPNRKFPQLTMHKQGLCISSIFMMSNMKVNNLLHLLLKSVCLQVVKIMLLFLQYNYI